MQDIFCEVTTLIHEGRYDNVLKILIGDDGHISSKYCTSKSDKNHACYVVGDIYFKRNEYKLAIKFFKDAILSSPHDKESIWALADCYSNIGNSHMALKFYKKSLSGGGGKHKASLQYNFANSLFDNKNYCLAIRIYKLIQWRSKKIFILAQKNIAVSKKMLSKNHR